MKAMIFAAGLGARLKPFTDSQPKALALVNKKTLLQRNIEFLARFGIKDIIINVHHFAKEVKDLLKSDSDFGSTITISDESDELLETGGGLKKAGWFFEEDNSPFVVMNVDVLTDINLRGMIEQHKKSQPLATLAVTNRHTSRYFLFDDMDQLCGWKNEKTGEQKIRREASKFIQKAFSGIHVISPKIFPLISMNGKFSMVDLYLDLANTHAITEFDHSNSKFIDVGKPESIMKAEKLFA
ncbi:MAG TPA: sugar phosphate nucleotidyltransferase [Chitinophagaceae bacterium]|nr:sugar phosphate nucleotidyltransferase [Chitinophagaceae bacterium]